MEPAATRVEAAQMAPTTEKPQASPIALLNARFEQFYVTVHRYLLHRLFDRELAEELAAETFYNAVVSAGRVRADEREMRMWLLRIATNVANHHYRKTRLRRLLLGRFFTDRSEASDAVPTSDGEDPRGVRVRAILQSLPSKDQAVLVLRYYERMSFEEIAAVLNCRETAVRTRLSRAIRQVRERLGLPDVSTRT